MGAIRWTKEELEALKTLCQRGMSAREIKETGIFGVRSSHSIEQQAQHQGWKLGAGARTSGFSPEKFKEYLNGSRRNKDS